MTNIMQGAENLITISVVTCLIVFVAMMIDLVSGLYKAKLRGELRTSQALRRTMTKFITYEGGILIATGVDILIHTCKLWMLFGLDIIYGIPVVTCLVGIFLLAVEWLSVREKADQKTKAKMNETAVLISEAIGKEGVKEAISEMIKKAMSESNVECVKE